MRHERTRVSPLPPTVGSATHGTERRRLRSRLSRQTFRSAATPTIDAPPLCACISWRSHPNDQKRDRATGRQGCASNPHSHITHSTPVLLIRGFLPRGLSDACHTGLCMFRGLRVMAGVRQPLTRAVSCVWQLPEHSRRSTDRLDERTGGGSWPNVRVRAERPVAAFGDQAEVIPSSCTGRRPDTRRHPVDDHSTLRPATQVLQPWMARESTRRQTSSHIGDARSASRRPVPDALGERFDRVTDDEGLIQVDGRIHAVYT